ncbi:hypothetical protein ACHMZP_30830 [Rhodococcus baikonurensis]|jgi:hypothetical protein|uniref:hypothetical protein n=1 Tax=Rhodococcus baikonurensis TaxID=172041 RepID=UPI0037AF74E4
MTAPTYRSGVVDSMIDTVANSLLRESGITSPTQSETGEVRSLAETIVRETIDTLAGPRDTLAHNNLVDVADLVASDPETASVDQVREVAIALRGLLDLRERLVGGARG